MKLISEGPSSYRGSASLCCTATPSACHQPLLPNATISYAERLSELREWHEVRSKVFAQVAITDSDHRNEALALAGNESRLAKIYSLPNIRLPALIQLLHNQASRTQCNPRITVWLRDRAYEIETVGLNGTDIVIYVSDR